MVRRAHLSGSSADRHRARRRHDLRDLASYLTLLAAAPVATACLLLFAGPPRPPTAGHRRSASWPRRRRAAAVAASAGGARKPARVGFRTAEMVNQKACRQLRRHVAASSKWMCVRFLYTNPPGLSINILFLKSRPRFLSSENSRRAPDARAKAITCESLDRSLPSVGSRSFSFSISACGITRTTFARTSPAIHLPIAAFLYNSLVFFPPVTSVTFRCLIASRIGCASADGGCRALETSASMMRHIFWKGFLHTQQTPFFPKEEIPVRIGLADEVSVFVDTDGVNVHRCAVALKVQ